LHSAPLSANFAHHGISAGANGRDFFQHAERQLFDRIESHDIVAQSIDWDRCEPKG
jgi:hypothetical protein